MRNIKEKIKNLFGEQKEFFKKYCMTFILIAVITLVMLFNLFETENIEKLYTVFILTTVLVFCVETFFKKIKFKIPLYIISLILSIIAKQIIFSENVTTYQELLISGLYISTVLLSFYKIIKDSNLSMFEYTAKIFNNYIIIGIASFIIELGALFIVTITNTLLLKDYDLDLYLRMEILIMGLFIIPACILGLLNTKNEVAKAIKIIICYILLPIVSIAELIIYIYLAKIIIIREIPSNVIFLIIASLFTFAFPTWTMINHFAKDNRYIRSSTKIIPYSFIPLICLQIYSIGIRIAEYSITPERYLGVILVLIEITAVILTLIKNQKYLNKIVLIVTGFVFITMCMPAINVSDFSWRSQLSRLTSVYKENTVFENLSIEEKKKAVGAYRYLIYDSEGKKHIPDYIDRESMNSYKMYPYENYYNERLGLENRVTYFNKENDITVEGYKKLRKISYYKYAYNEEFKAQNIDTIEFEEYNEKYREDIKYNLVNLIEKAMKNEQISDYIIELANNKSLWISSFELEYNKETKQIYYLSLDGYLLIR